ncbi:MAG: methyltransferase domain-containing protein [Chthoniobacterales bacterium]|nr:methyltransferase domain-containing protein [Chthoniobacterales bacterium]
MPPDVLFRALPHWGYSLAVQLCKLLLVPVLSCGLFTQGASAQTSSQAPERPTSDPYTGDLAIFEDPERDEKLQVERVMDLLDISSGSRVADIGAGSGWFTVRSARRVGAEGVVYAVEINRDYIRHIKRRAVKEKLPQIRTILGKPADPLLPKSGVDAVLLLKTYHEIAKPVPFLRRVRDAMRPNARLGVIDKNGIGSDHGVNADVVIKEAEEAGFELVEQHDFVKADEVDYFLIFERRP